MEGRGEALKGRQIIAVGGACGTYGTAEPTVMERTELMMIANLNKT